MRQETDWRTEFKEKKGLFVATASGSYHYLALGIDGNIHCFGMNRDGCAPPEGMTGPFVAIAAYEDYSLALRPNGSVACWGSNFYRTFS